MVLKFMELNFNIESLKIKSFYFKAEVIKNQQPDFNIEKLKSNLYLFII